MDGGKQEPLTGAAIDPPLPAEGAVDWGSVSTPKSPWAWLAQLVPRFAKHLPPLGLYVCM